MLLHPVSEKQAGESGWLRRLGCLGFCFFLIKGLMWLIVPALLVYFGVEY